MKRIMEFRVFESVNQLTDEQKEFLDEGTRGTWKVNSEGKINIYGSFDCHSFDLEDLKGIQFGHVSGNFYCSGNKLQTLNGVPTSIVGSFYCYDNSLQSLEGAPESVGGHFYCYYNSLQTLEGAPESVGGEFRSDKIHIPKGQWGFPGFLRILKDGNSEQKKLAWALVSPEAINKKLQKDPEGTMINLKSIWNSPEFFKIRSGLKIPKHLEGEMDLLGDLDGIGL